MKSRLLKKIKTLYGTELPLLEQKDYLRQYLAACSKNLAAVLSLFLTTSSFLLVGLTEFFLAIMIIVPKENYIDIAVSASAG